MSFHFNNGKIYLYTLYSKKKSKWSSCSAFMRWWSSTNHLSALVAESILDLLLLLDLVNIPVFPVGLPADHSQLSDD